MKISNKLKMLFNSILKKNNKTFNLLYTITDNTGKKIEKEYYIEGAQVTLAQSDLEYVTSDFIITHGIKFGQIYNVNLIYKMPPINILTIEKQILSDDSKIDYIAKTEITDCEAKSYKFDIFIPEYDIINTYEYLKTISNNVKILDQYEDFKKIFHDKYNISLFSVQQENALESDVFFGNKIADIYCLAVMDNNFNPTTQYFRIDIKNQDIINPITIGDINKMCTSYSRHR